MRLGASLDIFSCTFVLQTGQVTRLSFTTPSHAGFVVLNLANVRPTKPKNATKPKAKLAIFKN
jgi:hypothetical protein